MGSCKRKLAYSVLLAVTFYFFIAAIELIKEASLRLGNSYLDYLLSLSQHPLRGVGIGWFSSAVVQSGGAVAATAATFVGTGALSITSAIFVIFGTRIGATSTGLIASLFTRSKLKKGFRHGFEIAVANNIFNISVVVVLFAVEYFTHAFSWFGEAMGGQLSKAAFLADIPDFVEMATGWLANVVARAPAIVALLIGFGLLIMMLELFVKGVLGLFGGRAQAHKTLDKYIGTTAKAFFAGLLITTLIPSTNVTISLLVPLAAANIIDLKKAIPYILGANIGTLMDIVIASLVTGNPYSIGVAAIAILFVVIGALLWLPFMDKLYLLTKWICKHFLEISPRRAVAYLMVFLLLPFLMVLLL